MLYEILFLGTSSYIIIKYIFPGRTAFEKLLITLTIGILFSALNLGLYLSSREANIYELLDVGRMIEPRILLKKLSNHETLSMYYDEVKTDQYETRCLNASNSDFIGESFGYYGSSLIVINLVSFWNTGSSRSMLLLVLVNLVIDYCFISKYITLLLFKFTTCELIVIVRQIMPGLSFIAAIIAIIRLDAAKAAKNKLNQNFCSQNEDYNRLNEMISREKVFEGLDPTDILRRVLDDKAKKEAPVNNTKKVFKYLFVGYFAYKAFFPAKGSEYREY